MLDRNSITSNSFVQGLKSLVFPEICVMCGENEGMICKTCHKVWNQPPIRLRYPEAITYSTVIYDPSVSSVVLKAKEDRNIFAQELLARALVRSIEQLQRASLIGEFLIVPIPSSPQAVRKRGESFMHPILKKVKKFALEKGNNWQWNELLHHRRKVRDQAGLSSRQRIENLQGVFQVKSSSFPDIPIILVDDVITTGSTLKNAILALNERKMTVLGVATACASPHQLLIR